MRKAKKSQEREGEGMKLRGGRQDLGRDLGDERDRKEKRGKVGERETEWENEDKKEEQGGGRKGNGKIG